MSGRVTAEQACISYAELTAALQAMKKAISEAECERLINDSSARESCVGELFRVTREDPEGSFLEPPELCAGCTERIRLFDQRKPLRLRMGAAKRTLLQVGRRLAKDAAESPVRGIQTEPADR